jgi:uncharacterized protein (DUF302 family)
LNSKRSVNELGMTVVVKSDYESVLERVAEELKVEGFGVLTEIDVKATLKKKLDVEFRKYRILGACNPALAHRALSAVPEVGLVLPCNVTVAEVDEDKVEVSFLDPERMMEFLPGGELTTVAKEAKTRLERVVDSLRKG